MWQGIFTALVTPFHQDRSLDLQAFRALVQRQVQAKVSGLLICGSTGEAMSLSEEEQVILWQEARALMPAAMPMIAGVTAHDAAACLHMALRAKGAGADALSIAPPPYMRPSQEALYLHYRTIHDGVDLPLMVYDNPGRACVALSLETMVQLAQLPRLVAFKESNGQVERLPLLRARLPKHVTCLAGDDDPAAAYMAMGGQGVVSVASNIAPAQYMQLWQSWQQSDLTTFAQVRDQLAFLNPALFAESNPVGPKAALAALGLCQNVLRAPLMPMSKAATEDLVQALGMDQERRYG